MEKIFGPTTLLQLIGMKYENSDFYEIDVRIHGVEKDTAKLQEI